MESVQAKSSCFSEPVDLTRLPIYQEPILLKILDLLDKILMQLLVVEPLENILIHVNKEERDQTFGHGLYSTNVSVRGDGVVLLLWFNPS